jgi:hypothetical protein
MCPNTPVDAGRGAGLERERDRGGRRVGELRAQAGGTAASGGPERGREDDEGKETGGGGVEAAGGRAVSWCWVSTRGARGWRGCATWRW